MSIGLPEFVFVFQLVKWFELFWTSIFVGFSQFLFGNFGQYLKLDKIKIFADFIFNTNYINFPVYRPSVIFSVIKINCFVIIT